MKLVLVSLLAALSIATSAFAEKAPLDGTTAHGKIKNGDNTFKDDLIFADGMFTSTACKKMGFAAAPYKAEVKGKTTTFTAESTNAKGEKMEWTGTITGKKVSANGSHVGADGKSGPFSYAGSVAK
jgi:hypothetical protein